MYSAHCTYYPMKKVHLHDLLFLDYHYSIALQETLNQGNKTLQYLILCPNELKQKIVLYYDADHHENLTHMHVVFYHNQSSKQNLNHHKIFL